MNRVRLVCAQLKRDANVLDFSLADDPMTPHKFELVVRFRGAVGPDHPALKNLDRLLKEVRAPNLPMFQRVKLLGPRSRWDVLMEDDTFELVVEDEDLDGV